MASPVIDQVITDMTNADTEIDAAVIFIEGVPAMIQTAVDAALANGATADELQPVSDLGNTLQSKVDALTAALQPPPPPGPAKAS